MKRKISLLIIKNILMWDLLLVVMLLFLSGGSKWKEGMEWRVLTLRHSKVPVK